MTASATPENYTTLTDRDPIVEPTADFVPIGSNTERVHRRRICPKPICDDAARSPVFLHDSLEKLQRRDFVPLRGSHRFQRLALMIDCAPQIAEFAFDLHERLIQMPAPLRIAAHARLSASFGSRPRTSGRTGSTKTGRSRG